MINIRFVKNEVLGNTKIRGFAPAHLASREAMGWCAGASPGPRRRARAGAGDVPVLSHGHYQADGV